MPDDSLFTHRKNHDGSFDSICRTCFATAVRARPESELAAHEKAHNCESASLSENA